MLLYTVQIMLHGCFTHFRSWGNAVVQSLDHDASYLKAILGFLGLNDIEVITIGGTGMGEKHLKETEEVARKQIDIIVKNLPFN